MAEPATLTYPRLGALVEDGGTRFRGFAPKASALTLHLEGDAAQTIEMTPVEDLGTGLFEAFVEGVGAGARYRFQMDDQTPFPDPASRYQPEGVHGPSEVVDPSAYDWQDGNWSGLAQTDLVFYELHVGTFTPEGTLAAARRRLPHLKALGITAVELMPLADFPGRWSWGYDHAALFAPSRAYGTPDDLRAFVDTAHQLGLAVFHDVIYNHLGPDGAYIAAYAPMFTKKARTPWGAAINLDDEGSEGVRTFFIENARYWLREYHFDGLRLDATHTLRDRSEPHFLRELRDAVRAFEAEHETHYRFIIAEDHRNLNTLIFPVDDEDAPGYGLDGVWTDDFHHQVRNFTAGDSRGYYGAFIGTQARDIAHTLTQGWFYDGRRNPLTGKAWGTETNPRKGPEVRLDQCVICIQNHDQVGNRPGGTRLTDDIDLATYRAATAALLFPPLTPLLFQGQEWAARTPFQFFTDHNDEIGPTILPGRRREMRDHAGFRDGVPDPQDPATFENSKLDWRELVLPEHKGTLAYYQDLLALRKTLGGEYTSTAHGRFGLRLVRGDYYLLISFEGDASMHIPKDTELAWHSEQETYVPDPQPPTVENLRVNFRRPGAALFKTIE
ncbi:MAG: malto-oligosyltrehalose trehalohydrolase [Bacteroidota bacterium]